MKTTIYHTMEGKAVEVEYDENAPCIVCGEPVINASMGGTKVCPWCDCGFCRYCRAPIMVLKPEIDGGGTLRRLRDHMAGHKLMRECNDKRRI